jgi:peptidoglycan lytic transglycosylase D
LRKYSTVFLTLFFVFILGACSKQGFYKSTGPEATAAQKTRNQISKNTPDSPSETNSSALPQSGNRDKKNKTNNSYIPRRTPPGSDSEILSAKPQGGETAKSKERNKAQALLDESLDFCQLAQEFWQRGELEEALEALDQAYALILTLEDLNPSGDLIQQREDIRFLISKRILEIYASRQIVVNGDHNAIPRDMNPHVEAELKLFTTGKEKDFFRQSYARGGRYRTMMLAALKEAGLPEELSWLPLIESGYKARALSSARALGLWQFIPSTGYKFGLSRNTYIDERLDPEKATLAAIAYLKELHNLFGDWATVLAAYNCGEGRVLRVIRSQNVNYLDNFWDLYERLPRETARYVPRFLAVLHVIDHPERYGLDKFNIDPPQAYETVRVSKQVHLEKVADALGISRDTLYDLNPELRRKILPAESYQLKVPPGQTSKLLAKLDKIPVSGPPKPSYTSRYVYHRVKRGESISTIARRYGSSIKSISKANRLNRKYVIVAGQKLKVPVTSSSKARSSSHTTKAMTKHKVRKGDSLWNIARRYGTTTRAIQSANGLRNSKLKVGQVLKVPGKSTPKSGKSKKYRVKQGDSPFLIARRNQMPLDRFLRLNSLTPRSKIFPGQVLRVE